MEIKPYLEQSNLILNDINQMKDTLTIKQAELRQNPLYQEIETLKQEILLKEQAKQKAEDMVKDYMLDNGIAEFNEWCYELKITYTPWSLKVNKENEADIPEDYWRTKTIKELDKNKIKQDVQSGKLIVPWVVIDKQPKLSIKITQW